MALLQKTRNIKSHRDMEHRCSGATSTYSDRCLLITLPRRIEFDVGCRRSRSLKLETGVETLRVCKSLRSFAFAANNTNSPHKRQLSVTWNDTKG